MDLFRGRMSWRLFLSLLTGLPRESTYIRTKHPELSWGDTEHLLATLIDLTGQAHSKKGRWRRIPRPGDRQPEAIGAGPGLTVDELRARLGLPPRLNEGGVSDG